MVGGSTHLFILLLGENITKLLDVFVREKINVQVFHIYFIAYEMLSNSLVILLFSKIICYKVLFL